MRFRNFANLVILFSALFNVVLAQESKTQNSVDSTSFRTLQGEEVPELVVYERLFKMADTFEKEADEQEQLGDWRKAATLRTHFQQQALLSDRKAQQLKEIVSNFQQEVADLKEQAEQIRALLKSDLFDTNLAAQLRTIKEQRRQLWQKYRDVLQQSFGKKSFERFRKFVQEKFVAKMRQKQVENKRRQSNGVSGFSDLWSGSSIYYNENTNVVYGYSWTFDYDNGGGGGGPYFTENTPYWSDTCDWEEGRNCNAVSTEPIITDGEGIVVGSVGYTIGCQGEVDVTVYANVAEPDGDYSIDSYHELGVWAIRLLDSISR